MNRENTPHPNLSETGRGVMACRSIPGFSPQRAIAQSPSLSKHGKLFQIPWRDWRQKNALDR